MAMENNSLPISNPQTEEQEEKDDHSETSSLAEKEIGSRGGLKKRILRRGTTWQTPFPGDEVEVHYVGHVKDGATLGTSHDTGASFKFKLGQSEVIEGLDEGVATMKKGERAIFTVPPHLAYGKVGFPPLVPPNSTLIFDVEMISWATIRDVTGDGGVLKKIITEGEGWATPKNGDEVSVKYEAKVENGKIVSKSEEDVQFHIGDGQLCPAIHKAVKTMRTNEEAELSVKFSYGFGVQEEDRKANCFISSSNVTNTILLKLVSWRSVVDVLGDKKILKKTISAGEGFDHPNEGSLVKVVYVGKREDGAIFDQKGSHEEPFEYVCQEDQVGEGLDRAIMTMKKGEKAQVSITSDNVQRDEISKCPFSHSKLLYEVELLDFTKEKPYWKMDTEEKLKACEKNKQDGNVLFKAGKFSLASKKYDKERRLELNKLLFKKSLCFTFLSNEKLTYIVLLLKHQLQAVKCIEFNHSFSDEEKSLANALLLSCNLNNAACKLKLGDYAEAARHCTKVLELDPDNIKALFRRSQAYLQMSDLDKAEADIRKALTIDPNNRDIKLELKVIKAKQKEYAMSQAELFGTMIAKMV